MIGERWHVWARQIISQLFLIDRFCEILILLVLLILCALPFFHLLHYILGEELELLHVQIPILVDVVELEERGGHLSVVFVFDLYLIVVIFLLEFGQDLLKRHQLVLIGVVVVEELLDLLEVDCEGGGEESEGDED